jgi:diacylglycerol kinase (ATP)
MTDKNQSFVRRLRFAANGLVHALGVERSMRIHTLALLLVAIALIIVRPGPVWWALVALSSAVVIAAELFNTAIEHLADHLHPDVHPQIRIVKDCAAAAVLVASSGALAVAAALIVRLALGTD